MNILVLGASSFSGGWFVEVARAEGHSVRSLSRPAFDLNDRASLEMVGALVDEGYAHVVNYAALNVVPASWDAAPDYYATNVVGVARLADWLRLSRLKRFVQVSTPEVYGNTRTFLREGAPFAPSTPYAVSRAAIDLHLRLLFREFGFPVSFTRTVNVYGERQQAYRIVPKAIRCALSGERLPLEGGGLSTRSFIHAEDAARATLRVLESGNPGEDYHVAYPRQVRIRDLVSAICERLGRRFEDVVREVPERVGKDMAYQLDDSKIRAELGWRERIGLDEGLARTIASARADDAKAAA